MKEKKNMVLGITGGVGCGKSQVLAYLGQKPHTVVYDLDTIAHKVQKPGGAAYRDLVEYFGNGILNHDGSISRESLGEIVFKDPEELELLNRIVHPKIRDCVLDLINQHPEELLVIEGALLIQAGYKELCSELWHIYAQIDVRRERVLSSRPYTLEKFQSIVDNQVDTKTLQKEVHRTIDNSGTIEELYKNLDRAYKELQKM